MKLLANFNMAALSCCLIALTHLPFGNARALASVTLAKSVERNHTNQTSKATTDVAQENNLSKRSNDTAVTTLPAQTKSPPTQPGIIRKKRDTKFTLPFDFHTIHLPCDLDQSGRAEIIEYFPHQCIWVWNNRYVNEDFFRVYKTYQLEAFFFGQYHERLKRFELDPHTWDYSEVE
ncbi:uncharacterized protein LOC6557408 [Drosophila grimshawi]|uniref:uncharacterized protein LOC6557408 n=1 Tax=Drosophila grimshawi TaxID=7222 RepID=UPI001C934DB1|nr:uncharacterized protein LOC6557408 [Drosophila grimshawi]